MSFAAMESVEFQTINENRTIKLPVIITMYLFFAVRLSPDLLANTVLWVCTFLLFVLVSAFSILIYGYAKNLSFVKWYALFSLYSISSLVWTKYLQNVIEGLRFYLVSFFVFLVLSLLIRTMADFYLVIKVIKAALFTCFVDMLINLNFGLLFAERLGLNNINSNWNSNTLGGCLAGYIIFSILLIKHKRIRKAFIVPQIVIDLVFAFFTFLTGSRKSIIMLVLFLVLLQILESKKKFWARLFFSGFVVLVGAIAIMNVPVLYNMLGYRFVGVVSGTSVEGSYIGRSRMIKLGLEWFVRSPIVGYGVEAFRAMSPWNTYAHTNYVELLVDLGAVGVLIYYSWIAFFLLKRKYVLNSKTSSYIISSVVVFALLDFMQVSYNDLLMIFFLFSGFVLIDLQTNTKVGVINQ